MNETRQLRARAKESIGDSAVDAAAVDISSTDHTFTQFTRSLFVGTGGNLVVEMAASGKQVTLTGVLAGYHPLSVIKVVKTGTTAANIVGLF